MWPSDLREVEEGSRMTLKLTPEEFQAHVPPRISIRAVIYGDTNTRGVWCDSNIELQQDICEHEARRLLRWLKIFFPEVAEEVMTKDHSGRIRL